MTPTIMSFSCRQLALFLVVPFLSTSCSLGKIASDITSGIFKEGAPIFEQDSDIQTAEVAGLAMIKTLEVFYQGNQSNKNYLLLLSKSYGTYAFGFLENRLIQYKDDPEKYQMYLERARLFYKRGKDYGMQLLKKKDRGFKRALEGGLDPLRKHLRRYRRHNVAPLFWVAFNWGSFINVNKESVEAVGDLGFVEAIMARILEVAPSFYYAGPQLFYGVFYASRPPTLGGDPAKAKEHFDKAVEITEGKFLLAYALTAQFLAVQTQDRALFDEMCQKVDAGSLDDLPEQRLANALAKEKVKLLRQQSLF